MNQSFHTATLKLTGWYMLLLACISLSFSVIVFSFANHGFRKAAGTGIEVRGNSVATAIFEEAREQRIQETREQLLFNLGLFNLSVMAVGGLLSYFLARRTLEPINAAMEVQARFTSDAAHELRTPLSVMQSETEVILRDTSATKDALREKLGSNLEEIGRLHALTERLLSLASEQPLTISMINTEEVSIDAVNRLIALASTKKIAIDNTVASYNVQGNAEALTDTLVILLENAIKYSPQRTTIILSATQDNKHVTIRVADEGHGIKPGDQDKIFDRFYRADTSRSSAKTPGYGLGLSLAKRLVEQQDGTINLEKSDKSGSVFTLRLPKA